MKITIAEKTMELSMLLIFFVKLIKASWGRKLMLFIISSKLYCLSDILRNLGAFLRTTSSLTFASRAIKSSSQPSKTWKQISFMFLRDLIQFICTLVPISTCTLSRIDTNVRTSVNEKS